VHWTRIVHVDNERPQSNCQSRGNTKVGVLLFANAAGDVIAAFINFKASHTRELLDGDVVHFSQAQVPVDLLAECQKRRPDGVVNPYLFFSISETAFFDRTLFEAVSEPLFFFFFFFAFF
jgi:hypothetical protein